MRRSVGWGLTLFCTALVLSPIPGAGAQSPEQLNQQGLELLIQKQPQQASEKFQHALRIRPDDQQLQHNLGAAYLASGLAALSRRDYDAALDFFGKGRNYTADPYLFAYYAGYAHLQRGDLSLAEVALNDSLALAPDRAEVHKLLGRLYYASGRMSEALASLERARKLQANDPELTALLNKVQSEYLFETGLTQAHSGRFKVMFPIGANPELGDEIIRVLDSAYVEVGTWLNSFPTTRTPVVIYSREDFATMTGAPGWVAGVYDGKIRIPLTDIRQLDQPLRALLFHEYSHVVIRHLTRDHCPTWLHEGLAEFFARTQNDPPMQKFSEALKNNRLLDFRQLEGSLANLTREEVHLAYEQSYHFVNYLVDYFGWYRMRGVLGAYASGADTETAFGRIFADSAQDFDSLVRQWQAAAELK